MTPLFQLYDIAPVPLSVALPPKQKATPPPAVPTVGSAFTVTAVVAELAQPAALVAVTVYIVVAAAVGFS